MGSGSVARHRPVAEVPFSARVRYCPSRVPTVYDPDSVNRLRLRLRPETSPETSGSEQVEGRGWG